MNFPRFTAWLGANSSSRKQQRIIGELNTKFLAAGIVCDRRNLCLQYLPALRGALTHPLAMHGADGIDTVVDLMQSYLINRCASCAHTNRLLFYTGCAYYHIHIYLQFTIQYCMRPPLLQETQTLSMPRGSSSAEACKKEGFEVAMFLFGCALRKRCGASLWRENAVCRAKCLAPLLCVTSRCLPTMTGANLIKDAYRVRVAAMRRSLASTGRDAVADEAPCRRGMSSAHASAAQSTLCSIVCFATNRLSR
jgi:hypothetical protein